jgi:hypothetical protein
MWRFIKLLVIVMILAALGLIAFAYAGPIFFPGDFAPPTLQILEPVVLESG